MFLSSIFLPRKYCSRKCLSTWSSSEFFLRPIQKTFLNLILTKKNSPLCFPPQKKLLQKMFPDPHRFPPQKMFLNLILPRKCFSAPFSSPGNDLLLLAARTSLLPPPGIHLHNKGRVWQENYIIPNVASDWVSLTPERTSSHDSELTI